MNREIRVLESAFKSSVAGMDDWKSCASGLESRIDTLTGLIGVQRDKVDALRSEYKRLVDAKGENSREAKELEIKLNNETGALKNLERELSDTRQQLDGIADKADDAAGELGDLDGKTVSTTSAMGGLSGALKTGGLALLAFGAAATAAAIEVGKFLVSTIEPASDLAETANKINVVFGDAAASINDFAANAATNLGQTQQAALDGAATFGVFGKSAGKSGDDLAEFSTSLVTLSSDLASFYNTSPEQAIEAIGAALRGRG